MLYYFKAHLPQLLSTFVYVAVNPSVNITISKLPMCQEHKGPPLKIYLQDETRPVPRCLGGWCQNFPGFDSFSKIESHDWKVLERSPCTSLWLWAGPDWSHPPRMWVYLLSVFYEARGLTEGRTGARTCRALKLGKTHVLPSRSLLSFAKNVPDSKWHDTAGLLVQLSREYSAPMEHQLTCARPGRSADWRIPVDPQLPARHLRFPASTILGSLRNHNMCDRKRALWSGCRLGLILGRCLLIGISGSGLRSTKTFLKGMNKTEIVLCRLAVFKASDFPSSATMNN